MQQYTLDSGKTSNCVITDYYLICFIVCRMSPPPLDLTIPAPKSPSPPPLIGTKKSCIFEISMYCALVQKQFSNICVFFLQFEEAATCLTTCEATGKLFPCANDTIRLFDWQTKALFELSDPCTGTTWWTVNRLDKLSRVIRVLARLDGLLTGWTSLAERSLYWHDFVDC